MSTRIASAVTLLTFVVLVAAARGDEITQEGSLSGGEDPVVHEIDLDQFDTMGGTRTLNFVHIDYLTSVIGGGQADGSGLPVHLFAQLTANYSLDDGPLADTQATIDFVHPNSSPVAFTLFDTDTAEVLIDDAAGMAPWIGGGTIRMSAWTRLEVWADPPDVIDFSAGGTVRYTVTYDYDEIQPTPGDVDGDGLVAFSDLLAVLAAWGPCGDCANCPEDLDGDCTIGFDDLLVVLANWSA